MRDRIAIEGETQDTAELMDATWERKRHGGLEFHKAVKRQFRRFPRGHLLDHHRRQHFGLKDTAPRSGRYQNER